MPRKYFILILIGLFSINSYAQQCDCDATFNWVRTTFEENDAGFAYALQSKGQEAYAQHNKRFDQKITEVQNLTQCRELVVQWLSFFRSGHWSFNRSRPSQNTSTANTLNDNEIIAMYKSWDTYTVDPEEFKSYLSKKDKVDFEGIWTNGPYEIGIKKENNDYVGFIIKADGIYWTPNQIKLKIHSDNSSVYYMRDHSAENFPKTELIGHNYLQMGFVSLKRKWPEVKTAPEVERYIKAIESNSPYLERLNQNSLLLRIPSFSSSNKKYIDSVLTANKSLIGKSENLIIDIRNNGGGSDRSYQELIPILYTNSIRSVGVEYLSTPLNNQRMIDFIEKPEYEFNDEEKQWARDSYQKLSTQLGKFVNLNENVTSITRRDSIYTYPKQIAILINERNGSTAEQFLLLAKQSKKVKLYGTTTRGVLDISNMYRVPSPCGNFELSYGLTRSMRIPHMAIDDKGIAPDYFIDKDIPKHQWIDFALKVLSEDN